MTAIDRTITCPKCGEKFDKSIQVDPDEINYEEEHEDPTLDLD